VSAAVFLTLYLYLSLSLSLTLTLPKTPAGQTPHSGCLTWSAP